MVNPGDLQTACCGIDDPGDLERCGVHVVFRRRAETGVDEAGCAIFLRAQTDKTLVVKPVDVGNVLIRCDDYGFASPDE